jgi:hypothetical protein
LLRSRNSVDRPRCHCPSRRVQIHIDLSSAFIAGRDKRGVLKGPLFTDALLADTVWLGRHGSVLRGSRVELHSHRVYERGDDLRLVNWTLYARPRRLFVRESRQESRRPVYPLVDATASMGITRGPWSKLGGMRRRR